METKIKEPITIRMIQPEDSHFILSTWLRSYRYESLDTRKIESRFYYPEQQKVIEKLSRRPNFKGYMAVLEEDHSVIIGYLMVEENTIHYAYTKKPFRNFGIMKRLLQEANLNLNNEILFTHQTHSSDNIKEKYKELQYFPYAKYGI